MAKNRLSIFNTLLILSIAGGAFLFLESSRTEQSKDDLDTTKTLASAKEKAPTRQEVELLRLEVMKLREQIEAIKGVEKANPKPSKERIASPKLKSDESTPEARAADAEDPSQPLTRGEFERFVDNRLEKELAKIQKKWASQAREKAKKPKKDIRAIAQELALNGSQEAAVRDVFQDIERESFKLLFETDDEGLDRLRKQFEEARHNPELKAQLQEKVMINWAQQQSKVWTLYVKGYTQVSKVLSPEQYKSFQSFDVQLDERQFPDLEKYFNFNGKSEDDEDEE